MNGSARSDSYYNDTEFQEPERNRIEIKGMELSDLANEPAAYSTFSEVGPFMSLCTWIENNTLVFGSINFWE